MRESDQLKTAFTPPYGTFCYITMPFGLKNAGATYQRCMQRCLHEQLGRNVHVYVDDIAVMSRKQADLLEDLRETFDNLRTYRMKLNPKKCVFGVPAGKLLGFIIIYLQFLCLELLHTLSYPCNTRSSIPMPTVF